MGRRSNFYRSDAWQNLRRVLMMERRDECGILRCEHCGEPLVKAYDIVAHHVIELTEDNVSDPEIALNPDNIMLVHHECHNQIHDRFGYEPDKRVYYVWGSPLAGKTTFVRHAATANDLVVDLDSIYKGISINPRHANSQRLKANAFMVRDCLLDQIRTRTGKWQSAWVISTEALQTNRARMIDALQAEEIHIDTDRETCLERALERGGDAPKYTERFWKRLTE